MWSDGPEVALNLAISLSSYRGTSLSYITLGFRVPAAPVERSRASPPHRPREDELTHPTDTSRPNLAAALALLSRGFRFRRFRRALHPRAARVWSHALPAHNKIQSCVRLELCFGIAMASVLAEPHSWMRTAHSGSTRDLPQQRAPNPVAN
jgi:hypothetical protein